jgi:outer membrane protein assembly factor BamB
VGPNIGEIEFVGPVAVRDVVYSIGWVRHSTATQGVAYKLGRESSGRISATKLWDRELSKERTYATPLVTDERIYLIFWGGELQVLSAANGDLLSRMDTSQSAKNGSPSPTLGGNRFVVGSEHGFVITYSDEDTPKVLGEQFLEPHRATPLLDGGRIYIRGFDHLYCIE